MDDFSVTYRHFFAAQANSYAFAVNKKRKKAVSLASMSSSSHKRLLNCIWQDSNSSSKHFKTQKSSPVVTSKYTNHSIENILGNSKQHKIDNSEINFKMHKKIHNICISSNHSSSSSSNSSIFEPECILTEEEDIRLSSEDSSSIMSDAEDSGHQPPPNSPALSSALSSANALHNQFFSSQLASSSLSTALSSTSTPLTSLHQMTANLPAYLSTRGTSITISGGTRTVAELQTSSHIQKEENDNQILNSEYHRQRPLTTGADLAATWRAQNGRKLRQAIAEMPFYAWFEALSARYGDDPSRWQQFRATTTLQYQHCLAEFYRYHYQQLQQPSHPFDMHHAGSQFNPINILDALHNTSPLNPLNPRHFLPGLALSNARSMYFWQSPVPQQGQLRPPSQLQGPPSFNPADVQMWLFNTSASAAAAANGPTFLGSCRRVDF